MCGTLQLAAGMNLHTAVWPGSGTGHQGGDPLDLARRWHDLMGVNAGTIGAPPKSEVQRVREVVLTGA